MMVEQSPTSRRSITKTRHRPFAYYSLPVTDHSPTKCKPVDKRHGIATGWRLNCVGLVTGRRSYQ